MLKAFLRISKLNSQGKVIKKGRKKISKSFLIGFITILQRQFAQGVAYATNDITGTSRSANAGNEYAPFFINGGGGGGYWNYDFYNAVQTYNKSENMGIVVGIGTGAVGPSNYALGTKIDHGKGTGQLEHFGGLVSLPTVSGANTSYILERIFRNSSAGTIGVTETGIYVTAGQGVNTFVYCIVRDVLSSTENVAPNEYLKVTYTLQTTT